MENNENEEQIIEDVGTSSNEGDGLADVDQGPSLEGELEEMEEISSEADVLAPVDEKDSEDDLAVDVVDDGMEPEIIEDLPVLEEVLEEDEPEDDDPPVEDQELEQEIFDGGFIEEDPEPEGELDEDEIVEEQPGPEGESEAGEIVGKILDPEQEITAVEDQDVSVDIQEDRSPELETEPPPADRPLATVLKDDGRAWYVVHCYSGNEDKVRHNIMQRIESMSMDDLIFDVVVPTEDEVNIKNGERQTIEKKVFPGYILVNMILTEESWYMVRNTPGVTGFVGMGNDPTPLQPEEVARILKRMESESPRVNVTFRPGERVRIVDGPFEDFYGKVSEIDMERATVRVMVNFFGRETPVELDFLQVEEA